MILREKRNIEPINSILTWYYLCSCPCLIQRYSENKKRTMNLHWKSGLIKIYYNNSNSKLKEQPNFNMFQNWFSVWFLKLQENFLSGFLEYLNTSPSEQKYGIKKNSPETAYSPLGEPTVTADAFPMLSTGPRPTWLLKLRTCQPMTLASCWTACTWCCDICHNMAKKHVITSMCAYNLLLWPANCDTWDRRKSCSSCSWCDSGTTRPSLCTTRICSTPIFSCSWIDLNIQNTLSLTWEGLEIPVRPIFDWHWGPVLIRNKLVLW